MLNQWTRKRILIWGKTRPELSKSYKEIVCTGGVFEDSKTLVRLYPIPLRYMDDERVFKKYQWIEAFVRKAPNDPRPESFKIRNDEINVLDTIETKAGSWDDRAKWIMQPQNVFASVEALVARQVEDRTSLGLVRPGRVNSIEAVSCTDIEKGQFWEKYKAALSQMELPVDPETGREVKPIRPADFRYKIGFNCSESQCPGHECSVLDWELDALYWNLKMRGDTAQIAADKVVEKLWKICSDENDLHFYMGNLASHPQRFTIVGLWYPKKKQQLSLFT